MFAYMRKFAPENFYAWMGLFFKMLGLQPPKDKKKKFLYLLVATSHISMSTFLATGLEWTKLFHDFKEDFKVSMLTLSLCTLHSVFIFRIICWFFTSERLAGVAEIVQRGSFEFDCFGIYMIKYKHLDKVDERRRVLKYDELKEWWGNAKIFVNQDK